MHVKACVDMLYMYVLECAHVGLQVCLRIGLYLWVYPEVCIIIMAERFYYSLIWTFISQLRVRTAFAQNVLERNCLRK